MGALLAELTTLQGAQYGVEPVELEIPVRAELVEASRRASTSSA